MLVLRVCRRGKVGQRAVLCCPGPSSAHGGVAACTRHGAAAAVAGARGAGRGGGDVMTLWDVARLLGRACAPVMRCSQPPGMLHARQRHSRSHAWTNGSRCRVKTGPECGLQRQSRVNGVWQPAPATLTCVKCATRSQRTGRHAPSAVLAVNDHATSFGQALLRQSCVCHDGSMACNGVHRTPRSLAWPVAHDPGAGPVGCRSLCVKREATITCVQTKRRMCVRSCAGARSPVQAHQCPPGPSSPPSHVG